MNRPHLPSQRPHNLTSVYTSSGGASLIHRTHLRNPEQSSGPKSSPSCQGASLKTPEAAGQGAACSHTPPLPAQREDTPAPANAPRTLGSTPECWHHCHQGCYKSAGDARCPPPPLQPWPIASGACENLGTEGNLPCRAGSERLCSPAQWHDGALHPPQHPPQHPH